MRLGLDTILECCQTSSFAAGADAGAGSLSEAGVGSCVGTDAGGAAGSVIGSSGIAGNDAFRS
jgi:hypothetical protein